MTRTRGGGDGSPADGREPKRKKDRRRLAVESTQLTKRVTDLETIVVAQSFRLDVLLKLCEVSDADLVAMEQANAPSTT